MGYSVTLLVIYPTPTHSDYWLYRFHKFTGNPQGVQSHQPFLTHCPELRKACQFPSVLINVKWHSWGIIAHQLV